MGELHGSESSEQAEQLLANPGDAVAAVRLDLGGRIEGIQVEFGRVVDSRVDVATTYTSQLFGREVASNAVVIEGEGDFFVGVSGMIRDGIDGLSLQRNMVLGTCEVNQPVITTTGTKTLPRAGSKSGNELKELAPQGGFLVGMRIFIGRSWGGAIRGVQPIYQIGSDYQVGKRYGADGGLAHQVIARPGYAVGKIDARAGLVLNSVKLTFQRITDGSLHSRDSYESDRYGSPGGNPHNLDSAGRFMVGLGGSFHDDMVSLEAVVSEA